MIELRPVVDGIATWIPGLQRLRRRGTGGTDSARYCYSVWLRHAALAARCGLPLPPRVVAELGPGDSIGIGLAALLSGAERYLGFDVVALANLERNRAALEELIELFACRAPIPDETEFPQIKPRLESYAFPEPLVPGLDAALAPERLARLRRALADPAAPDSMVQYRAPWTDAACVAPASVDLIYSQAVLEHIDELAGAYAAMRAWLKPHGWMSHQIDFRSHGTSRRWNGHWAYSDAVWRLIRGGRAYLLNREPHSTHVRLLQANGFAIVLDQAVREPAGLARAELAARFRAMPDDDLQVSGWFVLARKAA